MYSVDIEVGDKTKRLKYDFNAIADIEERAGAGIAKLFSEEMIGLHTIRLLLWAGLRHADPGITIQRAGDMIKTMLDGGQTLEGIVELMMDALNKSGIFGQPSENPTKPEKSGQSSKA